MNLKLNKQSINVYKNRNIDNKPAGKSSTPLNRNLNKNISFKGDATEIFRKTVNKKGNEVSYDNIRKIVKNIDGVLGSDKFFSNTLVKAGLATLDENGGLVIDDVLTFKDATVFSDLFNTIAFPFAEMPIRIVNSVLRKMGRAQIETSHVKKVDKDISYKLCRDVLDKFTSMSNADKVAEYFKVANVAQEGDPNVLSKIYNLGNCTEHFKDYVAYDVNKLYKGYKTRDERTLNRMATSTVSALYSANDFYNISMLQKDDKDDAKKAHNSRFKQEMTRMMLSAGMTFLTLGALDRIVKRNIMINAVVIAMSSLVSEVGSRLFSKTPLHPLTPEQAKKIAQQRKMAQGSQANSAQQNSASNASNANNTKDVPFKGVNSKQNDLFLQFASKNGSFAPITSLVKSTAKEVNNDAKTKTVNTSPKKKKLGLSQILGLAVFASSAFYITSRLLKGQFDAKMARKKLYEQPGVKDSIVDYLSDSSHPLPEKLLKDLDDITAEFKKKQNRYSFEKKFKNKFLKYKTSFNVNELAEKVQELKVEKGGEEIISVLKEFEQNIATVISKADEKGAKLSSDIKKIDGKVILEYKKDLPVLPGFYNGFTKVFKTVYQILSAPGMLVEMLLDKTIFKESEMAFDAVEMSRKKFTLDDIKKELSALNDLVSKKNWSNLKKLDYIKRNTRSFETSAETGELANLSRTMVTAISTYFFVNDYTNKVLIESEGKDVEAAKEERKERLAHKVSNFIINGTLMNVFNSVFRFPLNRNLINATMIAAATETTNEFFVRKSICQPYHKMKSKQDIIDYENEQMDKKGFLGWWSRTFKKLTGKKSLTQKIGVCADSTKKDK